MSRLSPSQKSDLRKALVKSFDGEQLHTLCVDIGVDYDNLGGEGKEAKARELIEHVEREGRLEDLIAVCRRANPRLNWERFLRAEAAQDATTSATNESSDKAKAPGVSSHRVNLRLLLAIVMALVVVMALVAVSARNFILLTSPDFVTHELDPLAVEWLARFEGLGQKNRVIAFDPNARWVIIRGLNDYFAGPETPSTLVDALKAYKDANRKIQDVAFAPNSAWLIIADKNEVRFDSLPPLIPKALQNRLAELSRNGAEIKHVAIGPGDGYFVLLESGDPKEPIRSEWNEVPASMSAKLKSLDNENTGIRQVAIAEDGRWAVVDEKNRVWTHGVPLELSLRLRLYTLRGKPICWVAFTPGGGWVILTGNTTCD